MRWSPIPVTIEGIRYPSLTAAARELGLSTHTLRNRLLIEWSLTGRPADSPLSVPEPPLEIEYDGATGTVAEWAAHHGIAIQTIRARLAAGMDPARAVSEPPRASPTDPIHVYRGRTITQWASRLGINDRTLRGRVKRVGWKAAIAVPYVRVRKK